MFNTLGNNLLLILTLKSIENKLDYIDFSEEDMYIPEFFIVIWLCDKVDIEFVIVSYQMYYTR